MPQLARRVLGKSLDLPNRQETIVSGCARRGDSFPVCPQKAENHLNELQRQAQAMAISSDTRDGREMLTLLLEPPRTSVQVQVTIHTPLPQEPVQPTTARVL